MKTPSQNLEVATPTPRIDAYVHAVAPMTISHNMYTLEVLLKQ